MTQRRPLVLVSFLNQFEVNIVRHTVKIYLWKSHGENN